MIIIICNTQGPDSGQTPHVRVIRTGKSLVPYDIRTEEKIKIRKKREKQRF